MKGLTGLRVAAIAALAGVSGALRVVDGTGSYGLRDVHEAPRRRESATKSPDVTQWTYPNGPGWSVAQVKRAAAKARNRAKHRAHCR